MPPLVQVETNILPIGKLVVVFAALSTALLICFIDQNSIGVALPTIGKDLNAATTISWAGTSSLIANTVFQVLYGRISDIVGRKSVFLTAVGLLALGDLLCGFAQTGPQLYAFRGISGVGNGGITALTMMIVSDIVTLENRGKYQGILGSCVGLGNTIGPFLAAAFIEKSTWRGVFWLICPLALCSGVIVLIVLPPSKTTGDIQTKVRAIDYWGILFSTIAILLLLIPISGGGTYFSWSSPMVISMLTIGSVSAVAFIITEWKFAAMPMMPLHLFANAPVCAILVQNFLYGIVYYSHLYFLPIYYQSVRQYTPLASAALTIPFAVGQATLSIISGQYVSRLKRYGEVIWTGYAVWTLGDGLILLFNRSTSPVAIVFILLVSGAGVGNVFQPTLVAAQAHSAKHDRAVVISVRNFLRALGGAVGLALSSTVFSNVISRKLASSTHITADSKASILHSIMGVPDLSGVSAAARDEILDSYMAASRAVFTMWAPIMAACLLMCFLIKDRGLQRAEDKEREIKEKEAESREMSRRASDVETGALASTEVEKDVDSREVSRRPSDVEQVQVIGGKQVHENESNERI